MTALRILLMCLMCLVTDAPGPVTTFVFEHVEDGEEIQLSRRQAPRPRHLLARAVPRPGESAALEQWRPAPRPRPAARPAAHDHVRKVPSPAPEPAASSEDH
jgi:hypothetical protein